MREFDYVALYRFDEEIPDPAGQALDQLHQSIDNVDMECVSHSTQINTVDDSQIVEAKFTIRTDQTGVSETLAVEIIRSDNSFGVRRDYD